jgi:hypothetical protein
MAISSEHAGWEHSQITSWGKSSDALCAFTSCTRCDPWVAIGYLVSGRLKVV